MQSFLLSGFPTPPLTESYWLASRIVAQFQFFSPFWKLLCFSLTSYSAEIAYFSFPTRELSIELRYWRYGVTVKVRKKEMRKKVTISFKRREEKEWEKASSPSVSRPFCPSVLPDYSGISWMFDLFGDLSSWPSCIEMARAASGFLASPSNTHGCNRLKNLPRKIFSVCVKFGGNPCRDVERVRFYTHRHTHTDTQTDRHTYTN